jgi:aspartyl-tRNA synthetase
MLSTCSMSVVRGAVQRSGANARSLRAIFTAAAARPAGGASGLLPRRSARPSSVRPLQAAGGLAEAADPQQADGEGLHTSAAAAAASLLEPQLTWPERTHSCGAVTEAQAGQPVTVCGWVDRYRNLGGILFLDIRDHTGIVQVIVDPQQQPEVAAKAERLRNEYVVAVSGTLRLRSDPNPRLKTGTLEISPSGIKVGVEGLADAAAAGAALLASSLGSQQAVRARCCPLAITCTPARSPAQPAACAAYPPTCRC